MLPKKWKEQEFKGKKMGLHSVVMSVSTMKHQALKGLLLSIIDNNLWSREIK